MELLLDAYELLLLLLLWVLLLIILMVMIMICLIRLKWMVLETELPRSRS